MAFWPEACGILVPQPCIELRPLLGELRVLTIGPPGKSLSLLCFIPLIKVKMFFTQLCPTLHNPVDCRLPSSSLHGVLHARILEWVAIPFFRGSSQPKGLNFSSVQRKWQPTPVFLPGESQGWRSLVGCHLWGRTGSDTTDAT